MKTYWPKEASIERTWHLVDAKGKTLGRLATRIAELLIGKHKATFTPSVDGGDFLIVVNADDIVLTGNKMTDKTYYWHSGYPGGLKSISADKLKTEKPEKILWNAVYGMLPKNKLRDYRIKRLKIYAAAEHLHKAQQPVLVNL
jgi:large subunit ribosomal protein L13